MTARCQVIQAGTLVLPEGASGPGFVVVDGERIVAVERGHHPHPDLDCGDQILAPGFVDLQVNGAAGCDFLSPTAEGLAASHAYLLRSGTLAYLPTLISAPEERLRAALAFFAGRLQDPGPPRILGVHLEGPFLSPARSGAHRPADLQAPSLQWIGRLLDDFPGVIRMVTLAPELDGALPVIEHLVSRDIVVAVGHTDATYDQATAAFARGARLATHLFNTMRPYHHRDPGVVGAALAHPGVTCSIIADLVHLHPAVIGQIIALKGPDATALVTDAISAAGAAGAVLTLGDRMVRVADGAPRLEDGTLAGSVLAMNQAVRHVVGLGRPLAEAARMASATPARVLGLEQGELRAGKRADLVLLDRTLAVTGAFAGGRPLRFT
ncbi:MAG: N-acetylglucosamine-6-phosphate deacetylase [Armatimonadota bacterium]|nr:N-acetylglucosamine-6-phosphate deacetylase [Armatimonadota bacterium]